MVTIQLILWTSQKNSKLFCFIFATYNHHQKRRELLTTLSWINGEKLSACVYLQSIFSSNMPAANSAHPILVKPCHATPLTLPPCCPFPYAASKLCYFIFLPVHRMAEMGTILSYETWERGRKGPLYRCGSRHEEMAHSVTPRCTHRKRIRVSMQMGNYGTNLCYFYILGVVDSDMGRSHMIPKSHMKSKVI